MTVTLSDPIPWIDVGRHALQDRTSTLEDSEWICGRRLPMLMARIGRLRGLRRMRQALSSHGHQLRSYSDELVFWSSPRLREILERNSGSWGRQRYSQMKLWAIGTCILTASQDDELEDWLLNAAVGTLKDSGLTISYQLHQAMSAYLYSPRYQGEVLLNVPGDAPVKSLERAWASADVMVLRNQAGSLSA